MASKVFTPKVVKDATLFVANLNWTIGQNELKKYFAKFGSVNRTAVVFDKDTGLSKGYGFVTFDQTDSLEAALKANHTLEGRKLLLTLRTRREDKD